jgi:hypothetical protein
LRKNHGKGRERAKLQGPTMEEREKRKLQPKEEEGGLL